MIVNSILALKEFNLSIEGKRIDIDLQRINELIHPKMKELVIAGRKYKKEGELFVWEDPNLRPRYFFLFNDILMVTKLTGDKYHLKALISLKTTKIEDSSSYGSEYKFPSNVQEIVDNSFRLESSTGALLFFCASIEEKMFWMFAISNAIQDIQAKTVIDLTFFNPSEIHKPNKNKNKTGSNLSSEKQNEEINGTLTNSGKSPAISSKGGIN